MYLTEVKTPPRNLNMWRPGANQRLLLKFLESGIAVAEVTGWTHKNAGYAATALQAAAKKYRLGVRAVTRAGHVYLIRTASNKSTTSA